MCKLFNYLLLVFAVYIATRPVSGSHSSSQWGYPDDGEEFPNWGGFCDTGKRQSPIDLRLGDSLKGIFDDLEFINYKKEQKGVTLVNNGHTVQLANFSHKMILKSGPLESDFVLEQIHVHWWSEHTIENLRYPLEIHIVHRNQIYPDMTTASAHRDGLVVLAVLYHMSREHNKGVDQIIEHLDDVKNYTKINHPYVIEDEFVVKDLFPEINGYFTYPGSLTTPNCAEAVTWIVLQETFSVTQEQINKFKEIEISEHKLLNNNYRSIQKTNNRPVISVQKNKQSGASTSVPVALIVVIAWITTRLL